jgi:hypothetical protein
MLLNFDMRGVHAEPYIDNIRALLFTFAAEDAAEEESQEQEEAQDEEDEECEEEEEEECEEGKECEADKDDVESAHGDSNDLLTLAKLLKEPGIQKLLQGQCGVTVTGDSSDPSIRALARLLKAPGIQSLLKSQCGLTVTAGKGAPESQYMPCDGCDDFSCLDQLRQLQEPLDAFFKDDRSAKKYLVGHNLCSRSMCPDHPDANDVWFTRSRPKSSKSKSSRKSESPLPAAPTSEADCDGSDRDDDCDADVTTGYWDCAGWIPSGNRNGGNHCRRVISPMHPWNRSNRCEKITPLNILKWLVGFARKTSRTQFDARWDSLGLGTRVLAYVQDVVLRCAVAESEHIVLNANRLQVDEFCIP